MLKITTLGGLSLTVDDRPVGGFVSRKSEALLVYLAVNPREHPREVLSELLWDDLTQSQALSYLRTALSSLQKQLSPYLLVTRYSISINPDSDYTVDFVEMDRALTEAEHQWEARGDYPQPVVTSLETAFALYRGPFLDGFHVRSASQFEGWMLLEQERMQNRVTDAYFHLGKHYLERGAFASGIAHTTAALQLDPLREEAHRQMMLLLARSGQRSAALTQFETCSRLLQEELAVEPDDETRALYEQVLAGEIQPPEAMLIPTNLPTVGTPFVNRPQELQQITEQLSKPHCRLLTLTGPGGIGKTRLALEVARHLMPDFRNGVFFVSFAGVREPDRILETIANSLDLGFSGDFSSEEDVIRYLKNKPILFVLDNFEAMTPRADTLSRILNETTGVKMIVTSRERLSLVEEWLVVVGALPVPDEVDDRAAESPAVQLFLQSAQRMLPTFSLEDELPHVVDICRAVGGMPLAIELAASWVRLMSCEEILAEIRRGLDFLTTSVRNVPERHQSVRAVFDSSWKLLPEEEKWLYRRLSVFRGGFHRAAAEQVAGATVFELSALVDKSLLRPIDDRYQMHELLVQYAREKLDEYPDEREQMRLAHSRYFTRYLQEHETKLQRGPDSQFDRVIREIENIRAAWQYALDTGNVEDVNRSLRAMYQIFDVQSNFTEAEEMFNRAVRRLRMLPAPETDLVIARAQALQAGCDFRMDRYAEVDRLMNEALPVLEAYHADWEIRFCLVMLGRSAAARGDYRQAETRYSQALSLIEAAGDMSALANVLLRLASAETMLGNYNQARDYLNRGQMVIAESGEKFSQMYFHIIRGDLSVRLGRYAEAQADFEEALRLSTELDSRNNRAMILADLAQALIALGELDRARALCQQSIERNEELHNRWGIAYGLLFLGRAELASGDAEAAANHFTRGIAVCESAGIRTTLAALLRRRASALIALDRLPEARNDLQKALQTAVNSEIPPLILEALAGFVELHEAQGEHEDAVRLAARIEQHPAAAHQTRLVAQRFLSSDSSQPDGPAYDLNDVVALYLKAV